MKKNLVESKFRFTFAAQKERNSNRGVAQLVACYVRDVEVKSSSLFTPTT